jgi:hypothetical protein
MQKSIIVKISGGLGNNMFQYAVGRNLALKNNAVLILDLKDYEKNNKHFFSLLSFPVVAKTNYSDNYAFKFLFPEIQNKIFSILLKMFRFLFKKNVFIENELFFDNSIFKLKPDLYVSGYFQSERYFEDISNVIKNDFKAELGNSYYEKYILDIAKRNNSIALHVRRGDYLNTNVHGVTTVDYFFSALNYFEEVLNGSLNVCVFSDDVLWAKNNLLFPKSVFIYFADDSGLSLPHIDLILMSKFKHQIISNSTFSWWSAWLNSNKSKIVIAPKIWFLDSDLQNQSFDLVPYNWVRI